MLWADVQIKSKTQSNLAFEGWLKKVMAVFGISKRLNNVGVSCRLSARRSAPCIINSLIWRF